MGQQASGHQAQQPVAGGLKVHRPSGFRPLGLKAASLGRSGETVSHAEAMLMVEEHFKA